MQTTRVQSVCPLRQPEGQSRAGDGSKRLRKAGSVCHDRTKPGVGQYPLCVDQYRYPFSAHQHDAVGSAGGQSLLDSTSFFCYNILESDNINEVVFLCYFVLMYLAKVDDFENTHYGFYWKKSQPCLPSGPSFESLWIYARVMKFLPSSDGKCH